MSAQLSKPETTAPHISLRPAYSFPGAARGALSRIVEQIDVDLANVPHRVVLVTAPQKGDGASTVAWWLVSYLASTHRGKLLYVDASMQGGAASADQPTPADAGSAGLVQQVRSTGVRDIDTLELRETAAGRGPALHDVADALAQLREEYAWIVIDAPPPSCFSPRSVFLVQHADGVFLVLEANRTDRDQALETVDLIRRSGGRVIGALLNKTKV
jgi:Mrp family chromosome partitioning ATPase